MKRKKGEEDYLRVIYLLDDGKGVRSIDIAKELKISKPSVSEMIKKITRKNLVKKRDKQVFLTKKGKATAENLFENHSVIRRFLQKFLNHSEQKASEEAHLLEHVFSEDSIRKLTEIVEGKTSFSVPSYIR